jgi:predicted alpha/beta-hydrolase family hydrolase
MNTASPPRRDASHQEITFVATDSRGTVSAILNRPPDAWCLYVLAHGAGAGIHHAFFSALVPKLASLGIATFCYQFPYMEKGSRRPDHATVLEATVRSAVVAAMEAAPDLPIVAGGKSMGGRMTSRTASIEPLPGVLGLVFLGFPLHPAGKPSTERSGHLDSVNLPMLFLQGTRDRLADLELLRPVIDRLGDRAQLQIIADGDHSFQVLKRSGRSEGEVFEELAGAIAKWGKRALGT